MRDGMRTVGVAGSGGELNLRGGQRLADGEPGNSCAELVAMAASEQNGDRMLRRWKPEMRPACAAKLRRQCENAMPAKWRN